MTIRASERPKSSATMDILKPESEREYVFRGSDVETEILLAAAAYIPAFDVGIDAITLKPITLFRGPIKANAEGTGVWGVKCTFGLSQSTVELNFTLGVQSTKIQQALADVRSYSCLQAVSTATNTAAAAAITAATTLQGNLAGIAAAAVTANASALAAITANAVGGVDATVFIDVSNCVTQCQLVYSDSITLSAAAANMVTAVNTVGTSAGNGNVGAAVTAQTSALNYSNAVDAANATASLESINATALAALATVDASGQNAQSIAAAAAAVTAAADAATLNALLATAGTNADAALTASGAAVAAASADQQPGGNGVPDFKAAIGVGKDGHIEGCEIETGAVRFTITKKWQRGILPSSYFITLAEMTDRTVVNDAIFTFAWMGQTLSFARGTLRFRGSGIKMTSQGDLEITYDFAYQRPIVEADNFTLGGSARIVKEGMEYLWVRFVGNDSQGCAVAQPRDVHIVRVYPYDSFDKLRL